MKLSPTVYTNIGLAMMLLGVVVLAACYLLHATTNVLLAAGLLLVWGGAWFYLLGMKRSSRY